MLQPFSEATQLLLDDAQRATDRSIEIICPEQARQTTIRVETRTHAPRRNSRQSQGMSAPIRPRWSQMALLMISLTFSSAEGQTTAVPALKEAPSIREQIKADRAKAKIDEEAGPKERFWDRDANGERPWDRKEGPPRKE
jgi:hypothetical protein